MGLTQTAVFVVPLAAGACAVVIAARGRPRRAVELVAASSIVPLASGLAVALTPSGSANAFVIGAQWPWSKVVASWPVAAVLIAATLAVVLGALRPGPASVMAHSRQRDLAIALVTGLVLTLPPVFWVVKRLTEGDAIAFRTAWMFPIPALVGLLGSVPAARPLCLSLPVAIAATLVVVLARAPLWSTSNASRFTRPGVWKVRDEVDLYVARWIEAQRPSGTYFAGNWLAEATGIVTSTIRPSAPGPTTWPPSGPSPLPRLTNAWSSRRSRTAPTAERPGVFSRH